MILTIDKEVSTEMDWNEIKTLEDIEYLHKIYDHFEDSTLVSYHFESGNFVDEDLVGYEYNSNKLCLLFQRLDTNPNSIEIMFEYTRRFNFFAPVGSKDSWSSYMDFAKIVKDDHWFYWTTWEDFDPNNQEHLNYNDFILIQAEKVKWRIVK